jgi:hypothetical protein
MQDDPSAMHNSDFLDHHRKFFLASNGGSSKPFAGLMHAAADTGLVADTTLVPVLSKNVAAEAGLVSVAAEFGFVPLAVEVPPDTVLVPTVDETGLVLRPVVDETGLLLLTAAATGIAWALEEGATSAGISPGS